MGACGVVRIFWAKRNERWSPPMASASWPERSTGGGASGGLVLLLGIISCTHTPSVLPNFCLLPLPLWHCSGLPVWVAPPAARSLFMTEDVFFFFAEHVLPSVCLAVWRSLQPAPCPALV
ncbi:uncharacterized protein BO87DRAFT_167293 [Aspergillus neoniger CBS 115656]|uniref:Uncharacterized protein n=1 Tax=Aspergillus neoniger (strain CBS 115656) TaxID=1448310 RepID=A0A318Z093_ASPNB|nr:hypothetical protein BO87DRAFT_167293 [Aspergillus neoniger CBS 115656]PYH38403.1 hypothetical protein BO87DRAFT_167293 [Aspergillus neoniger CBS 115656]